CPSVRSRFYDNRQHHRWRPALASFACLLIVALTIGLLVYAALKAVVGPWGELSTKLTAGADTLQQKFDARFGSGASSTPTIIRDDFGGLAHLLLHGALSLLSVVTSIPPTLPGPLLRL